MKNIVWLLTGLSAAALYVLITRSQQPLPAPPVDDLAHKLKDAWADHHTVV